MVVAIKRERAEFTAGPGKTLEGIAPEDFLRVDGNKGIVKSVRKGVIRVLMQDESLHDRVCINHYRGYDPRTGEISIFQKEGPGHDYLAIFELKQAGLWREEGRKI